MNDTQLDELLSSAAAPLPQALAREASNMADATKPERMRRRRAPRARWVAPVLVGGSLLLTAGASAAIVEMLHWGGVSMPSDNVRNTVPIPVEWTTDDGHAESCRAWIELRNPGPEDRATLDAAIQDRDWSGFGQQLYATGMPADGDPDGEQRVGDALTPAIQDFAAEALPGVLWFSESGDTVAVDAWGMTCVPERL